MPLDNYAFTMHDCTVARAFLPRSLAAHLAKAARQFPVVVLTGPRQSGKTTLLRRGFERVAEYVSLEPPDVRASAERDPRGFLALHPPPVIFDEVQLAPGLMPYVKEIVDAHRDRKGRFFLTGSQNLSLSASIGESLAGRAAMLRLLPCSLRELAGDPDRALPWERRTPPARVGPSGLSLWSRLLRGGYPEVATHPRRDVSLWHASYLQTYLERDVRALRQVGSLTEFQAFLQVLAARSGQLLNMADASRDLGVALNTVKAWISILEATYQILVLRPYFANVGKRLVKTPKIYFSDVGMLCQLTGMTSPRLAATGPFAGAIFETAVVSEIVRALSHRGTEPRIWFYRTAKGEEVDLVVEAEGRLVPIEAKASSTPRPAMAAGIAALRRDLGLRVAPGWVVHAGDVQLPLGEGVTALPLGAL